MPDGLRPKRGAVCVTQIPLIRAVAVATGTTTRLCALSFTLDTIRMASLLPFSNMPPTTTLQHAQSVLQNAALLSAVPYRTTTLPNNAALNNAALRAAPERKLIHTRTRQHNATAINRHSTANRNCVVALPYLTALFHAA